MKTDWQILVVEDEEVTCESLAAWLREDLYTLDTAASGRDAIEKARSLLRHKTLAMEKSLRWLRWLASGESREHNLP